MREDNYLLARSRAAMSELESVVVDKGDDHGVGERASYRGAGVDGGALRMV